MHKKLLWLVLALLAGTVGAAERRFDVSEQPLDQAPAGYFSTVAGTGKPGEWKVIATEVPLAMQALSTNAPNVTKKSVIAQLAEDFTDEHFPMLILGNDTYNDFTLTTRFKIVGGVIEQMAGVAFRVQDEKNYYVVRASALGNNLRFYKMVNGQRGPIIGPEMEMPKGVWHELTVECKGNQIHILLDGTEAMPTLTDNTFSAGRIAFWTKSDSVSYFADTRLVYTPREPLAQGIVRDAMVNHSHLLGLQVFMMAGKPGEPRLVASNQEKEIGQAGRKSDADTIARGTIYYNKEEGSTTVTLPLRDRNGDSVAAVRVKMKSFKGQTEENAILRALPVVKQMQERVPATGDLAD
ncbi:MAG: hypothetical protein JWR19_942 [Pedosphaera sp.]|nr:hypothetical protein [Pedosphaera sp.]